MSELSDKKIEEMIREDKVPDRKEPSKEQIIAFAERHGHKVTKSWKKQFIVAYLRDAMKFKEAGAAEGKEEKGTLVCHLDTKGKVVAYDVSTGKKKKFPIEKITPEDGKCWEKIPKCPTDCKGMISGDSYPCRSTKKVYKKREDLLKVLDEKSEASPARSPAKKAKSPAKKAKSPVKKAKRTYKKRAPKKAKSPSPRSRSPRSPTRRSTRSRSPTPSALKAYF